MCVVSDANLLQQSVVSRDVSRNVVQVKEDMEGGVASDQVRVAAVSEVEDGVDGIVEVGAGGVHGDGDGAAPPGQQRLQVVQEAEVSVGGVGDCLVAVEQLLCPHVVVQHPVLVPHALEQMFLLQLYLLLDIALL